MQNLEQIRAAAAARLLPNGGQHPFSRADVSSIPALILSNGLLAAAAFCCEEGKEARNGMRTAFDGIANHLRERQLADANTGRALAADLARRDSLSLQRATVEALAFLAYLKRYSVKR